MPEAHPDRVRSAVGYWQETQQFQMLEGAVYDQSSSKSESNLPCIMKQNNKKFYSCTDLHKRLVRLIKMCLNETFSKVCVGKHLSDTLPIQNGLKQGDALLSFLFNFAIEYAIRKVQGNQVSLELNGAHQLLFYADDDNLLGDSINTIEKNSETLVEGSRDVGLEINADKTKYIITSHHQN
jgi:hypothetical protein